MRLIMMGTGPFAVPTFRALKQTEHELAALVTKPLSEVRTRKPAPRHPMREAAEELGVPILSPDDVNSPEARGQLAVSRPDLFVVCDYGQLLSSETLAIPARGGINLHGSLLPRYRGAAPINWAILNGDIETGVTVIHMTPRLDAGPCLSRRRAAIGPDETAVELEPRLATLGADAVLEALALLSRWDGVSELGEPQDPRLVTRAPRLRKSQGRVDWSRSAREIVNQVRAMKPWPGTYTFVRQPHAEPLRIILDRVSAVSDCPAAPPATVVQATGQRLIVATGEGGLSVDRVQPAGKRAMEIGEFLRGHPVHVGEAFESTDEAATADG